ncbi:GNAT family N-acetyltransferase [Paenibacillaceae bacterium]|nr:GNAT family N-acetyltransferase [Paenibacillaceae bacterium]
MEKQLQWQYAGLDIRQLGLEQVADVHKLMQDVASRLPSSALFAEDKEADFRYLLEEHKGEIYGAYDEGKLVAYTVLVFPGRSESNLGRELGVPEEELARVGTLDATIAHEAVRGRGLQRYFHSLREQRAKALGYRYLYSTVHPDNAASRRNLESAGFVLQFTRPMYGGHPRHCYGKRLEHPE